MNLSLQLKKDAKELIEQMGFYVLHDPEVQQNDDRYAVSVFVDEPRKMIGERGANLQAFQHIFRLVVSQKYEEKTLVDVDINGYKKKRAEFLRDMAHSARRRAVERKQPVELEPMNPFDRRVVHTALSEQEDVNTASEGEGGRRRVVVHPTTRG